MTTRTALQQEAFSGERSSQRTDRQRVSFSFPEPVVENLKTISEKLGRSQTEFLRLAIGTYIVLSEELAQGNRVVIMDADRERVLKELVLPA